MPFYQIDELRSNSEIISIQSDQKSFIDNMYSQAESNHVESPSAYIVLDTKNATLGFEVMSNASANAGSVTFDVVNYDDNPETGLSSRDALVPKSQGAKVIVGGIHPHPTPEDGSVLVEGVSEYNNAYGGNDKATAVGINAPFYAVDRKYIHKVNQHGNVENKKSRSSEVLIDALKTKGGKLE